MPSIDNEDPLMAKIREDADVIRYLCAGASSLPADAWSKRQLLQMIEEIKRLSELIITRTGVADLDAYFKKVTKALQSERGPAQFGGSGADDDYQPYTGDT